MLRRVPVKKLSAQITVAPAASSRSHRCEPRKPAPPVTSTRVSRRMLTCCSLAGAILFDRLRLVRDAESSVLESAPAVQPQHRADERCAAARRGACGRISRRAGADLPQHCRAQPLYPAAKALFDLLQARFAMR